MAHTIYHVDHTRCANLEGGRRLEWLVTNGRGGFAMATVNQMLTRRYHGLLVAAVDPPVERFVLLAKLDATVTVGGRAYELATNDYVNAVHPHGYRFLDSFTTRPYPSWRWRAGSAVVEQTLCMAHGEDTTFVRYRLLEADGPVTLSVQPLCTSRHFHILTHSLDLSTPTVESDGDRLTLHWAGQRPLWHLAHNGTFEPKPDWHYQFFLATEARRGYDETQDLFTPGVVGATLGQGDSTGLVFAASTQDRSWQGWRQAFARSASQDHAEARPATSVPVCQGRRSCVRGARHSGPSVAEDPLVEPLKNAASQFLVARGRDLKTVIAGYPWFGDWGRDTFISLPGLCLVPSRLDDARRIIEAFAQYVDGGMIPNRFPDFGEPPAYNTADATLWYVYAIDRYLTYSGDWAFVADRMFPVITEIIDAHERGTRHGIRLCDDGLLAAGEPGVALTWMDAQLPGCSITPRIGKPVEINALWYNGLQIAASYAERLGKTERADKWHDLSARARASFNERFWNESADCLYDVIDGEPRERRSGETAKRQNVETAKRRNGETAKRRNGETSRHQSGETSKQDVWADGAIRPNQLFAISLTHPVLDRSRWLAVVSVCERELWTPMGMRTLSPSDPAYRGRYEGNLPSRDGAYHQGTVWPWLLGPFVTAYTKILRAPGLGRGAHGATRDADIVTTPSAARRFLDGLLDHLCEAGIGSISEVADGDPPHTPGGCPWQAWSVAEPLRALCEDVLGTHPPVERTQPAPASVCDR
ncbi:MAG: glycogen debranching enzyme family protein [Phycisphaerae bacterium]|nr:glycogen debranching enzyme family protein [Phycisphaerae bacterium]